MAHYTTIAKTADIPLNQIKSFTVEDEQILIANWQGTLFATQDLCTHDNGTLSDGELVGGEIECPRHGAHFDLQTGRVTILPAMMPIKTFPVKIEGDQVLVALD